jgi:hypothetical protein
MTGIAHALKAAAQVAVVASLFALGGCSADDIELNGALFDMAGIGSGSKKSTAEPKMAARSPIVLPPNLQQLPAPGSQPGEEAAEVAALRDPDKMADAGQAELERQQAEYCKKNYEQALAHGDRTTADLATGPLGPCRRSILKAVDVVVGGEKQ